jgi:L-fucose/D-arabinose isomerase
MKYRLGLLSVSDGRPYVHREQRAAIEEYNRRLQAALEATGQVEVIPGEAPLTSPTEARREAERLRHLGVAGTIFHQCAFGFPHLAVVAAQVLPPPFMVLAPTDSDYPALVSLLTVAGAFAQLEIPHTRVWGDSSEPAVVERILTFARACTVVHRLRAGVFGLLGGRSMGLYTGAPAPNLWLRKFGIDVDQADQVEILDRARLVAPERAAAGIEWLGEKMGGIEYGEPALTPALLELQVRGYLATKDLAAERGWDFVGLKCHCEMSEAHFVQCLSAALLNDPYDWEGPREPLAASCEADCDGALSMHILKLLTGQPAALMDVRAYDGDLDCWVLSNCGAAPTWFAARSDDPAANLARTRLMPAIPKYHAGGAHVRLEFAPGPVTLARLQRVGDGYQMVVAPANVVPSPARGWKGIPASWPFALVHLEAPVERVLRRLSSNHLHVASGDVVEALRLACDFLGLQIVEL